MRTIRSNRSARARAERTAQLAVALAALFAGHGTSLAAEKAPAPTAAAPAASSTAASAKSPKAIAAESAIAVARTYSLGYDLCYVPRRQAGERFAAWKAAAEAGDADGKFMLAMCEWYGIGTPRVGPRAWRTLRELADANHAGAQALLGILIWNGTDQAEPDLKSARELLKRSKEAGHSMGRDALLDLDVRQLRMASDAEAARMRLEIEVKKGSTLAKVWLAELLAYSPTLPNQELDSARELLVSASDAGNVRAVLEELRMREGFDRRDQPSERVSKLLEQAFVYRDASLYRQAYGMALRGAFKLTPADAEKHASALRSLADPYSRYVSAIEARADSFKGQPKEVALKDLNAAVARGFAQASINAALFYRSGIGTRADEKKCVQILERAARALDPEAINGLATAYRYGWSMPANEYEARSRYFVAAALGERQAMNSVGLRYYEGRGVPRDREMAMRYFHFAAFRQDTNAMQNLAREYSEGGAVPQDSRKAMGWLALAMHFGDVEAADGLATILFRQNDPLYDPKAAVEALEWGVAQGSGNAMHRLSGLYAMGQFVPRDFARARALLKQGSEIDHLDCMNRLADDYLHGTYGPANPMAARKLFERAAGMGHPAAMRTLAHLIAFAPNASPAEVDKARKYVLQAIELGDADAYETLAYLDRAAAGGTDAAIRAFIDTLSVGAAKGSEACAEMLCQIKSFGGGDPAKRYLDLRGGERLARDFLKQRESDRVRSMLGLNLIEQKRFDEAKSELERAAANGYPEAMNSLGVMYRFGKGVPQDDVKALEWYRKAAAGNHESAMANISYFYEKGLAGLKPDPAEAFNWLKKAFDAGPDDGEINLRLAKFYADGIGTPSDDRKAIEHAVRSARAGHPGAQAWCRERNLSWN